MTNSVKIRKLVAPEGDLTEFDPGRYLSELEFYETDEAITDEDRDGLAQFVHYLAFLALSKKSTGWPDSMIETKSTAFAAIQSHFGKMVGWEKIATEDGIPYRFLASFLMTAYPPQRRQ